MSSRNPLSVFHIHMTHLIIHNINTYYDTPVPTQVAAASASDHVVLVVGLDGSQEGEGRDRTDIDLPGVQHKLIAEVAAAAKVRNACTEMHFVS